MTFWLALVACTWLALTPSPPTAVFRVSDILLHGLAFTYLTFNLALAYHGGRLLPVAGWMLGYGLLLELLQGLVPSRTPELGDMAVNAAGIALGGLLFMMAGERVRRVADALIGRMSGRVDR